MFFKNLGKGYFIELREGQLQLQLKLPSPLDIPGSW